MKFFPSKLATILGLVVACLSLPARAALYSFNYGDSGVIPQGGTTFAVEHNVTVANNSISSIEIILTFNDSTSLSGNSSGIQGHLILGTSSTSPFVNFFPVASSSSGQERIYDVTFTGSSGSPGTGFNGLNPNGTWDLVLWDNSNSGFENGLVSWTLDITAVPEPVGMSLMIFGVIGAGWGFVRWRFRKLQASNSKLQRNFKIQTSSSGLQS